MARKLNEILQDMAQALTGQKPQGHTWAGSTKEAVDATVGGLKGLGSGTLTGTAEKFNLAMPYIERAGYDIIEIEVGIGLSPKLVADLKVREQISDEEKEALLLEVENRPLVSTILSSLFKAASAREKLSFNRFHFASLELELSILPTVSLKFLPGPGPAAIPAQGTDIVADE